MPSEKRESAVADALELTAVLCGAVGVAELFSLWVFGLSLIGITALLISGASYIRSRDEKRQANAKLEGSALVDESVISTLIAGGMPLHIIRAVARVGTQEVLEKFRDGLKAEAQNDITDEQLDTILRIVRVPAGALRKASPPVVPLRSKTADMGPGLVIARQRRLHE